jgi:hypothetical protein
MRGVALTSKESDKEVKEEDRMIEKAIDLM